MESPFFIHYIITIILHIRFRLNEPFVNSAGKGCCFALHLPRKQDIIGSLQSKESPTMHDELTKVDIEKMQQELDHRRLELRPKLIEEVQIARSFGDLSENFEYKAAKREKNRNDSRIRYLERMIKTAVVIEDTSAADEVGLFDTVTVFLTDEQEEEVFRIVTTLRQNPLKGLISKESPIGSALMGKKVGDIVHVQVNERFGYDAKVIKIEKGTDDEDLPIMKF